MKMGGTWVGRWNTGGEGEEDLEEDMSSRKREEKMDACVDDCNGLRMVERPRT